MLLQCHVINTSIASKCFFSFNNVLNLAITILGKFILCDYKSISLKVLNYKIIIQKNVLKQSNNIKIVKLH